ncbi:MAG TPA: hypothetical protein VIR98_00320 [Candidatus Paceibacterota bacterium]|jgi:hypothetical protein
MQNTSHSARNLIIILVVLIIIGAAGYFYAGRDQAPDDLLTSAPVDGMAAGAVEGDLLPALLQLKKLRLDDTIFSDASFTSLVDSGQTLAPQPQGRPNPFAPIDASSLSSESSSVSSGSTGSTL